MTPTILLAVATGHAPVVGGLVAMITFAALASLAFGLGSVIIPPTDISSAVEPKIGIVPQAISGATPIDGTGVDRLSGDGGAPYESCDLEVITGANTGTPTSIAHTFAIQDSADNATFANYNDSLNGNNPPTVTANAASAMFRQRVSLKGARQYVRVVCTPVFTGGSSPTTQVACTMVMGGAAVSPTP